MIEGYGGVRRHGRAAMACAGVVTLLVGLVGVIVPRAGATPQYKYYTAAASPLSIYGGTTTLVSVTLANSSSSNQPFGSAEITFGSLPQSAVGVTPAPDGWTDAFASPANGASSTVLVTSAPGVGVAPGGSLTLSFDITPTAGVTSIPVITVVKQSNDFSGAGNNFSRPKGSLDPTIAVVPVTLTFEQQPSTIQAPQTGSYQYMCPPVSVLAEAGGNPVNGIAVTLTASSGTPGLYWGPSPGAAITESTGNDGTGDGLAVFGSCGSGLSAANIGSGYTLQATSPAAASPAVSLPFSVVQYDQLCKTSSCNTGQLNSSTGTTGQVGTTSTAPGRYDLLGSFGQGPLECDALVTKGQADPLVAQITPVDTGAAAYALVTMVFPKSVVNSLTNNGTPLMQVCAGATQPFTGSSSYPGETYPDQGLLPDCPSGFDPSLAPAGLFCVVSRAKGAKAIETIQIYVGSDFTSDPSFW